MIPNKRWLLTCLTIASLFGDTVAQTSSASFAFPIKPTGTIKPLALDVADTVVLEWTSNFQDAWLWLFCDAGTPGSPSVKKWGTSKKVDSSGSMVYNPASEDIDKGRDWTRAYECHFDLNYADEYKSAINGPIFSISSLSDHKATTFARQATVASLSPSTTPATTPGTTPKSTSNTTPTTKSNATPNATPNSTTPGVTPDATPSPTSAPTVTNNSGSVGAINDPPSGGSGLSSGAIAGIAIGAVAGVMAILALGVLLWRRKRRTNNIQARGPLELGDGYIKPQGVEAAPAYQLHADPPYKGVQMTTMHVGPFQAPQELAAANTEHKA